MVSPAIFESNETLPQARFSPLGASVAVVVPCYKVTAHVLRVLEQIGPEVDTIYCVDDGCPDGSGDLIERECKDTRVRVLRHDRNQGVGAAVATGYQRAAAEGAEVLVKLDGDGQMDPSLIPAFVQPILRGEADYTKGNRFFDLSEIRTMPRMRIFGNAVLSLMGKLSTGYWDIFDPTNGFTAIHADVWRLIPTERLSKRYFFESDLLFRLATFRAVVVDIPMRARYGNEVSGLEIRAVLGEFARGHLKNLFKRIGYNYVLRDLPLASLQLLFGTLLMAFGLVFGGWHWWVSYSTRVAAPTGTVMIPALSLLMGLQLTLAFLSYDIANVPKKPLHPLLPRSIRSAAPEKE